MTRTILIVLEILIGVAAIGGEACLIMASRPVFAGEPGLTPAKTRVLVDLVLLDILAAITLIAAWLVVTGASSARVVSIVAGVVTGVIATTRPSLTGSYQPVSSTLVVLGLAVVLLGILLPAPG